jgi:hypothetical protein
VARLGGYGPEAAKATGRPMCKGSCQEKAVVLGGVSGLGGYRPEAAKATGRPMCKGSCKEKGCFCTLRLPRPLRIQCVKAAVMKKGGVERGGQIRGIWR